MHRPYPNRRNVVVVPVSKRNGADQGSTPYTRTRSIGLYNKF